MTYVIMTEAGPVEEALLDGYGFGDRLLEGVMFRVTVIEGNIRCLGHVADAHAYMKKFSEAQLAEWDESVVRDCKDCGDNLTTADGQDAWIEIVEADPKDPLAAVRENEDPASDYVDANALLGALGRGTVRPIEAESFGDISKRIVGKLSPIKKTG